MHENTRTIYPTCIKPDLNKHSPMHNAPKDDSEQLIPASEKEGLLLLRL